MPSPVKLYVYDVTHGMASQMAPFLIGRPLDGVWHTGVVVYGNEYFFGGGGINYCPPTGTILGHPTQIVDLGDTEIPLDMFHDYLYELSLGRFHGNAYHLLDHNCNNFSNEAAQFLTGRSIPENITNLPRDILATPFGQMIRPFIDSMMMEVTINNSVHIGPETTPQPAAPKQEQSAAAATTVVREESKKTSQNAASTTSVTRETVTKTSSNAASSQNTSNPPSPPKSPDKNAKEPTSKKDDLDLD